MRGEVLQGLLERAGGNWLGGECRWYACRDLRHFYANDSSIPILTRVPMMAWPPDACAVLALSPHCCVHRRQPQLPSARLLLSALGMHCRHSIPLRVRCQSVRLRIQCQHSRQRTCSEPSRDNARVGVEKRTHLRIMCATTMRANHYFALIMCRDKPRGNNRTQACPHLTGLDDSRD